MSKKTITFTLPPSRPQRANVERQDPPDHPQASAPETDAWVFAVEPDALQPPDIRSEDRILIDLSARRSWFELVQLIWAFPVLATWFWMAGIAGSMPGTARHR
jgi:hypothetical protein